MVNCWIRLWEKYIEKYNWFVLVHTPTGLDRKREMCETWIPNKIEIRKRNKRKMDYDNTVDRVGCFSFAIDQTFLFIAIRLIGFYEFFSLKDYPNEWKAIDILDVIVKSFLITLCPVSIRESLELINSGKYKWKNKNSGQPL